MSVSSGVDNPDVCSMRMRVQSTYPQGNCCSFVRGRCLLKHSIRSGWSWPGIPGQWLNMSRLANRVQDYPYPAQVPSPIVRALHAEQNGQFSPDGHWIAFQSAESGRVETYVQPFPGPGNKWPISTNGGSQVRWRRDGQELFYVGLDGRLMAVPIRVASTAGTPEVGTPVMLFARPLGGAVQHADYRHQYMVSSDGQRFLVATVTEDASSPITFILNWKPKP